MPSTETRPVESDADTGEDDGYAHYARKEEIARAAVLGGTDHRPVRAPLLAGAGSAAVPGVPEVQGAGGHAVGLRLGTRDGPGSGDDAPP